MSVNEHQVIHFRPDNFHSRRKVAAMGGMSAQIPIKNDPAANDAAMAKVRADKLREVTAGHDGTWIAHPLICKIAMEVFDEHMLGPNQVSLMPAFIPCLYSLFSYFSTMFAVRKCPSGLRIFSTPSSAVQKSPKTVSREMFLLLFPIAPLGYLEMDVFPSTI